MSDVTTELAMEANDKAVQIARLKAENAKLRESLEYANNEWEKESMEYLSTQVDNAKLRELVRDMYEMAYPEYPSAFEAAFADRMRELGVEVDE